MFQCVGKPNSYNVQQRPVDLTASEVVAEAVYIAYYSTLLRCQDTRQPQLVRNAGWMPGTTFPERKHLQGQGTTNQTVRHEFTVTDD
jgi:hypothetical protein